MTKKTIKPGFIPLEKGVNCNSRPSGNVQSLSLQPVRKRGSLTGFTLIELMVAILLASIGMLAIGIVIADAHKGYNRMYNRIQGAIITDAYAARLKFDKICRRAMGGAALINGASNPSIKILYYSAPNLNGGAADPPDRYAEFYLNNSNLMLNTGPIATGTPDTTETVAGNVTELKFSAPDPRSVQMVLTLGGNPAIDNGYSLTVTSGSIMHN